MQKENLQWETEEDGSLVAYAQNGGYYTIRNAICIFTIRIAGAMSVENLKLMAEKANAKG